MTKRNKPSTSTAEIHRLTTQRPYLPVIFANQTITALYDSGSDITLCDSKMYCIFWGGTNHSTKIFLLQWLNPEIAVPNATLPLIGTYNVQNMSDHDWLFNKVAQSSEEAQLLDGWFRRLLKFNVLKTTWDAITARQHPMLRESKQLACRVSSALFTRLAQQGGWYSGMGVLTRAELANLHHAWGLRQHVRDFDTGLIKTIIIGSELFDSSTGTLSSDRFPTYSHDRELRAEGSKRSHLFAPRGFNKEKFTYRRHSDHEGRPGGGHDGDDGGPPAGQDFGRGPAMPQEGSTRNTPPVPQVGVKPGSTYQTTSSGWTPPKA